MPLEVYISQVRTETQMRKKPVLRSPVHPGEILREEFLKPLELSINALARALHVPPNHVSGIINEKCGISALMALRLARYFGTSPELWLGLQEDSVRAGPVRWNKNARCGVIESDDHPNLRRTCVRADAARRGSNDS